MAFFAKIGESLKDEDSKLRGDIGTAADLASDWFGSGADDDDDGPPPSDELPEWAIPAAIGGGLLLLVLIMRR